LDRADASRDFASNSVDLQRFLDAQDPVYSEVCDELRRGRKRTHWMWFIFPQLRGLGHSSTAAYYGIASLEEAEAYLAHPVLGSRLMECCHILNDLKSSSAEQIFGYPDYLKFRSCLTLFQAASGVAVFTTALDKFFGGEPDSLTLDALARAKRGDG
jgi:uncharacterized protein (DUF1810 family)